MNLSSLCSARRILCECSGQQALAGSGARRARSRWRRRRGRSVDRVARRSARAGAHRTPLLHRRRRRSTRFRCGRLEGGCEGGGDIIDVCIGRREARDLTVLRVRVHYTRTSTLLVRVYCSGVWWPTCLLQVGSPTRWRCSLSLHVDTMHAWCRCAHRSSRSFKRISSLCLQHSPRLPLSNCLFLFFSRDASLQ